MIGNAWIQLESDGEHGRGEIYVVGYPRASEDGKIIDRAVGGRYLDRYERRQGEWRIIDRMYVLDWNRNTDSTAIWDEGMYALLRARGARFPEDPYDRGLPARRDGP
jgi:hypothetical protein